MLTSPDHWDAGVLRALAASDGVAVRIVPLTDDAGAFADVSSGAVVVDIVSGDGLWIPAYHAAGLTDLIDLSRMSVSQELYPVARTMDLLVTTDGMLGYPWSWSPLQIVYDPTKVASAPDSWDVLVDSSHTGRVVIEEQQMDLVLCAGVAVGAADPLDMTDAELASATDWLTRLKPNIRRIVHNRGGAIDALASGECSMAISGLGAPDLVKDAGGPEVVAFVPTEGTIGSIEAEMVTTGCRERCPSARLPRCCRVGRGLGRSVPVGRPAPVQRARISAPGRWGSRRSGPSLPVRSAGGRAGHDAHRARRPARGIPGGGPGHLW